MAYFRGAYKSRDNFNKSLRSLLSGHSNKLAPSPPTSIMKTLTVVAVVALLVYTANATPCTDICNAQCTIQQQSCAFTEIFGNLCDTINGVCTRLALLHVAALIAAPPSVVENMLCAREMPVVHLGV